LLYFRGRKVEIMPAPNNNMVDANGQPPGPGQQQQQQMHKRPSPLQIRHPEMADVLLVEEHIRTRLHYMASEDVVLRYATEGAFNRFGVGTGAGLASGQGGDGRSADDGQPDGGTNEHRPWDDASFIPRLEEVLVQNSLVGNAGVNGGATTPKPALKEVIGKNGQVKLVSSAAVTAGKKVKGPKGKGGKAELQKQLQMNGSPVNGDNASKDDGQPQVWEKRWNGRQLPASWLEESASGRNMACILTYRHFLKVRVAQFAAAQVELGLTLPSTDSPPNRPVHVPV
jgi:hypothetical protein